MMLFEDVRASLDYASGWGSDLKYHPGRLPASSHQARGPRMAPSSSSERTIIPDRHVGEGDDGHAYDQSRLSIPPSQAPPMPHSAPISPISEESATVPVEEIEVLDPETCESLD